MSVTLGIGLFALGYVLGLCIGFVAGNLELDSWRKWKAK